MSIPSPSRELTVDDPLEAIAVWERAQLPDNPVASIRLASHRIDTPRSQLEGQSWPLHAHRAHELLWGIDGLVTVSTPSAVYAVPGGASIWIPADVPHEVHAGAGSSLLCSWFAADEPRNGLDEVSVLVPPVLLDHVLTHLMQDGLSDAARANAEAFALDLLEPTPRLRVDLPLPTSPWLRVVTDAIIADPSNARTVEAWAEECSVSVRTLMRRFATETGMPLSRWRADARIRFAIQRLTLGDGVQSVARATGFRTAAAFGAAFRRRTGVTPGMFARRGITTVPIDRSAMQVD
ncbi:AraC family transcriptional regulator [Plantibacter sp. YIM 135347]|uniref:AraC family transcriptional regulator n=1 Tax=Plantibacter sp. YIM 135347 TaxID=3423919 RepID=UPI003D3388B2